MPTDPWDPRAAVAGTALAYPSLTSPYPQSGVPAYTDPVARPAPTLTTVAPATSTVAAAVAAGSVPVTLTGTNFTNASQVSFGSVLGSPRVTSLTYVAPTTLKATLIPAGLVAAAYPVVVTNQGASALASSAPSNFTLT